MPAAWVGAAAAVYGVATAPDGSSGSPSSMADPFAGERGQYQPMLSSLMNQGAGSDTSKAASSFNAMLQPGYQFNSSDPSYAFRMDQGIAGVNRGAAKSGLLDSGNRLTALNDYAQGTASTEFGAEFARRQSAVTTNSNLQQQNYAQLAQLSGANSGQPGQAGALMANEQAGAAAQIQQLGQYAGQAYNAWNNQPMQSSPGEAFGPVDNSMQVGGDGGFTPAASGW